ncbi:MAG: hypothetical protein IJ893_03310 [Bacteroidales bacterium]|nr:hypothetical protein [Bacteroidales bacterium]MBR2226881.1 hypothetical protein [Bacteroidales bacterium]
MQVFTLFSSVFFRGDEEGVVFYNTDSFVFETFKVTPATKEMCRILGDMDNLYSLPVDEENINYCKRLSDRGFGRIHEEEELVASFPPTLVIRKDWEQIKLTKGQAKAETLQYLSEITLFIGGQPSQKDLFFLQTEYPYPGDAQMDYSELCAFLDKVSRIPELRIKFVFPYIKDYPNIIKIINRIGALNNQKRIFVKDQDYYGIREAKSILQSVESHVVVLNDSRHLLSGEISNAVGNRFLIFEKTGVSASEECVNKRGISNFSFIPIFDGTNELFIKEATFPTEQEILGGSYTKRHVFSHQVINSFYFGHLFITPDGRVYSDLRERAIGTMQDDLHTLIITELDNNFSWRRTRSDRTECRHCRYLDLCPSIGPLEKTIGTHCLIR